MSQSPRFHPVAPRRSDGFGHREPPTLSQPASRPPIRAAWTAWPQRGKRARHRPGERRARSRLRRRVRAALARCGAPRLRRDRALAGLLGQGSLDQASTGTIATGVVVDYEPIARFGTTTQITVHTPRGVDSIRIDSAPIEPMGLETIVPQPIVAAPDGRGTVLRFVPSLIRLRGKPSQTGRIPVAVVIGDGTVRSWTDYVLPAVSVVLRAALAYWILLIAFRPIGRRTTSQLAPFDLIVLFLLAGSSITAVLGDDHSMVAAIGAISTIGLMHLFVPWAKTRSPWFGRMIDGTPVVVFENGEWHDMRMRRLRIEKTDILAAARARGLLGINQVLYVVVERSGAISVAELGKGEVAE